MKVYDAATIRNVAIVGHSGSGKTQLTSAILSDTGMVNRFGKVDEGTTVTDFDEEEIARKHTLSASLAYAEWNKNKINLIDTPGVGNFLADAVAALHVADAAAVVVDAVSGPMVQTEKVWEAAEALGLPRLVLLNRLDRERSSLTRSLEALREVCNRTVIPIQLPIGEEKSFKGIVDLVTKKAFIFQTDGSGKFAEGEIPATMTGAVAEAREALIELVAAVGLKDEGLLRHEIDNAFEGFFFADGQLNRNDRAVADLPQRLERAGEAGSLAVEPIEQDEPRQAERLGRFPHLFGLHHRPRNGVDHDGSGVGDMQCRDRVGQEIADAWRVDEIDLVFVPLGIR